MDITKLSYLKAVAEHGNITRAAEELHITQSALSRSIMKTEEEVGVQLFERIGNRIYLNLYGQAFLRHAVPSMTQLNEGVQHVREMAGLNNGEISVSSSTMVYLDYFILNFLKRNPNVCLRFLMQTNEQMITGLEEGSLDFALSSSPLISADIHWIPLMTDHYDIMLSTKHPLSGRSSCTLAEFKNEKFVISNLGMTANSSPWTLCALAGFTPDVLFEGWATSPCEHAVADSTAVMITPHSVHEGVTELTLLPGVTTIPLTDPQPEFHPVVGVARKESHMLSKAAKVFLEEMCEFFRKQSD